MKENLSDGIVQKQDKVDGQIITACITLIAAFAVIISIKKPTNEYLSYAYISSLGFLTVSLLSSFWHKYRYPKRQDLYKKEVNKVISDLSGKIADFWENILIPLKQRKLEEARLKDKQTPVPELAKKVNDENDKHASNVIMTYLEQLNYKTAEKREEIFNKPLNEKNAITKFRIDKLTSFIRYPAFVAGIIFFFISIFMNLTL